MTPLPIYQVDAFTSALFGGNPAAVCPLDDWLPDATMQAIAAENNLSETAFFLQRVDPLPLRWFTPTVEVPLCGHATLASAYVMLEELRPGSTEVRFSSRVHGVLTVRKIADGRLELDFPALASEPAPSDEARALESALGKRVLSVLQGDHFYLALLESEADVANVSPDMARLARLPRSPIVTAPGSDVDFVSRFFTPSMGIDEDPVTGSAHCLLTPFWAERLGKTSLAARQLSARRGELRCELHDRRVHIAGHAVLYLRGHIYLPA